MIIYIISIKLCIYIYNKYIYVFNVIYTAEINICNDNLPY